ncbi:MAG TPA: nitronate monooxygenase [Actinomycetes bacterium]|nr:nitronate monooxygenase [Actinomycetes bacterium]
MLTTPFTELLGARVPLQQAPMGGVTTSELVAAVAAAGAVGMVPAQMLPADVLARLLDDVGGRTDGVVGVTFLLPYGADPACVEVAAAGARLVDFYYGDPDPALVARVHEGGALASWQAGSVAEARAAADAGCDLICVQGMEGGGRIRGRVALLPLLAEVLDAVEVPVVAAGGIATARGVAACLAAGAAAARVGTRLLATEESGGHPAYVAALLEADAEDAVLTDAFSVMWPRGPEPHRTLGSAVAAAEAFQGEVVGETRMGATTLQVPRFGVPCPNRDTTGEVAAMAHYAGQSVGATREVVPAAQVIDDLASGAERLLRRWG